MQPDHLQDAGLERLGVDSLLVRFGAVIGKDGGEFEINQTKASVGLAVGHVAQDRDRRGARRSCSSSANKFLHAFVIDVFHAAPQLVVMMRSSTGIGFEQSRHEIAAAASR